ncbi:CPBP family intramembrane metalloprotease (plasmid) [Chloroflexota bacterium]|nr:CPBP family intramembrane metalloprotease [Chloroflexota bacterium]
MKTHKVVKIAVLVLMVIITFGNVFGVSTSGLSILLGLSFFFIFKIIEKKSFQDVGLEIRSIGKNLKNLKIWLWILLPLVINFAADILAKIFLPGYEDHIIARSSSILSVSSIGLLIIQLAIFALGEEIAWRAFFQKQIRSFLPAIPTIIITSILFSMGHLTDGNFSIVIFDLLFIFFNSLVYGIIFEKTNNAWISALSHFIANIVSAITLYYL